MIENSEISVFATCPPFDPGLPDYPGRVADTSRWSEAHGCRGALVYTDNGMLDPWLVAQLMMERTERLRPLVAVQPVYTHPYTVAKAITSLAALTGRAVDLNWVAGGFTLDLQALGESAPHDERYSRMVAYADIVSVLLAGDAPVTREGGRQTAQGLTLTPPSGARRRPGGARRWPSARWRSSTRRRRRRSSSGSWTGRRSAAWRLGIIARDADDKAWAVALRFPPDREGG